MAKLTKMGSRLRIGRKLNIAGFPTRVPDYLLWRPKGAWAWQTNEGVGDLEFPGYLFRVNSLHRPSVFLPSEVFRGTQDMAKMYFRYCVVGFKWKVTVVGLSSPNFPAGLPTLTVVFGYDAKFSVGATSTGEIEDIRGLTTNESLRTLGIMGYQDALREGRAFQKGMSFTKRINFGVGLGYTAKNSVMKGYMPMRKIYGNSSDLLQTNLLQTPQATAWMHEDPGLNAWMCAYVYYADDRQTANRYPAHRCIVEIEPDVILYIPSTKYLPVQAPAEDAGDALGVGGVSYEGEPEEAPEEE